MVKTVLEVSWIIIVGWVIIEHNWAFQVPSYEPSEVTTLAAELQDE